MNSEIKDLNVQIQNLKANLNEALELNQEQEEYVIVADNTYKTMESLKQQIENLKGQLEGEKLNSLEDSKRYEAKMNEIIDKNKKEVSDLELKIDGLIRQNAVLESNLNRSEQGQKISRLQDDINKALVN